MATWQQLYPENFDSDPSNDAGGYAQSDDVDYSSTDTTSVEPQTDYGSVTRTREDPTGSDDGTTVDTSTQTLGTTSLGTATGPNDADSNLVTTDTEASSSTPDPITITTTNDDPTASSPAGGVGETAAQNRAANTPSGYAQATQNAAQNVVQQIRDAVDAGAARGALVVLGVLISVATVLRSQ